MSFSIDHTSAICKPQRNNYATIVDCCMIIGRTWPLIH